MGNGDNPIDRLAGSPLLAVAARGLTILVATIAIPYLGWTVSSIYDTTRRVAVIEGQVNDLRVTIAGAYRTIDAARELVNTDQRLSGIDHRLDRVEDMLMRMRNDPPRLPPPKDPHP